MQSPIINGHVAPGYERVADTFASNIEADRELGAACAIRVRGELVVDIWGGYVDREGGRLWGADTLVPVYSVTKGVAAVCVLHLAEQGLLDLEAPVSHYWPEFGAHGKDRVTIREALAHRAGVPYLDRPIPLEDLRDPVTMSRRVAAQQPMFEPGTSHRYHPVTIGWITGELVRRVTGQSLGQWLRGQVAEPLGLDLWIGLPSEQVQRVARLEAASEQLIQTIAAMAPPDSPTWKAGSLNGLISLLPGAGPMDFNNPELLAMELAGAGLVSNARSLAAFYATCLREVQGIRLVSSSVANDASRPLSFGREFGMGEDGASWGTGVMVPWANQPMLGASSFGHDGFGGSLAFADPPSDTSFAYVRNRLALTGGKDDAVYSVVDALAATIGLRE